MMFYITEHAYQRATERLGIPSDVARVVLPQMWQNGLIATAEQIECYGTRSHPGSEYRIARYEDRPVLMVWDAENVCLRTVITLEISRNFIPYLVGHTIFDEENVPKGEMRRKLLMYARESANCKTERQYRSLMKRLISGSR